MVFLLGISLILVLPLLKIDLIRKRLDKRYLFLGVIVLQVQWVSNTLFSTFLGSLRRLFVILFNEFHDNGVIAGELDAYFITLIPKE